MISFHSFQDVPSKYFKEGELKSWLIACAEHFDHEIKRLAYKFCDENEMLDYNQLYLGHDYYTDILTFPEHNYSNPISGDVLINVDRLVDNAAKYDQTEARELLRLMSHGLLHLCGYRDETEDEKRTMTSAENICIGLKV